MRISRYSWPIFLGIIWSVIFAIISFYWASGGMIGAKTLGGEIYQMAIERKDDFILIVWLTGFLKIIGGLLLGSMFTNINNLLIRKTIFYIASVGGILIFTYGLANFAIIFLSIVNLMDIKIDNSAKWWRLIFWEPYWMVGGLLYIISGRRYRTKWNRLYE